MKKPELKIEKTSSLQKTAIKGTTYTNYLAKKINRDAKTLQEAENIVSQFVRKVSDGGYARKIEDTQGPYYGNIVKGFNRADKSMARGKYMGHNFDPGDHAQWYDSHSEFLKRDIIDELSDSRAPENLFNFKIRPDANSQAKYYAHLNNIDPSKNKPVKIIKTNKSNKNINTGNSSSTQEEGNIFKALGALIGIGAVGYPVKTYIDSRNKMEKKSSLSLVDRGTLEIRGDNKELEGGLTRAGYRPLKGEELENYFKTKKENQKKKVNDSLNKAFTKHVGKYTAIGSLTGLGGGLIASKGKVLPSLAASAATGTATGLYSYLSKKDKVKNYKDLVNNINDTRSTNQKVFKKSTFHRGEKNLEKKGSATKKGNKNWGVNAELTRPYELGAYSKKTGEDNATFATLTGVGTAATTGAIIGGGIRSITGQPTIKTLKALKNNEPLGVQKYMKDVGFFEAGKKLGDPKSKSPLHSLLNASKKLNYGKIAPKALAGAAVGGLGVAGVTAVKNRILYNTGHKVAKEEK